jgi:hypothetical protein
MSYAPTIPYSGLGKVFSTTINTPFGNQTFSVDVPYEQWAEDAINVAVAQLQPLLPQLVQAVVPLAMNAALPAARTYILNTLWPDVKPKLRAEVDNALVKAGVKAGGIVSGATTKASIIGGLIITGILGAAVFVVASKKRT